jgi:hypothetical protein
MTPLSTNPAFIASCMPSTSPRSSTWHNILLQALHPVSGRPLGKNVRADDRAARSGRQNIVEGSVRAATSKETEMKLTDVARASLGETVGAISRSFWGTQCRAVERTRQRVSDAQKR